MSTPRPVSRASQFSVGRLASTGMRVFPIWVRFVGSFLSIFLGIHPA